MDQLESLRKIFLFLIIACLILVQINAVAEYRTFELEIQNSETGQSRTIITNFDQYQYPQLHPLNPGETVVYVTSWMCWENTSQRPPCKKAD